ncbi:hypothetical protein HY031_01950 [Candidatus Gottesmanbacteria bacterium]|nr:hypothetical protein [Candidatus Gottesmanbacteria bacterium]
MNVKVILIALVLVVLLATVGAGGFYLGNKYRLVPVMPTPISVPAVTPVSTPVVSAAPTPTPTPNAQENATLTSAVKQGLIAEHGPDAVDLNISVTKIVGNFAQGSVSGSGGGAIWFAAKVKGTWVLVWDGNGTISCNAVAPYADFPKSMIPECWNDTLQKMVTR